MSSNVFMGLLGGLAGAMPGRLWLDCAGKDYQANWVKCASTDNRTTGREETKMARSILDELHLHPAIRERVTSHFHDTVQEVQAAVAAHRIVVVGMAGNPSVKGARKLLDQRQLDYQYLEYGSYFNAWRRRNSLKMWTGWATFPMVFIDGMLIGGYQDLKALANSGELSALLAAVRQVER